MTLLANAQELMRYKCEFIKEVDGDTYWGKIYWGDSRSSVEMIRLFGIDTPERGEDGYKTAKNALSNKLRGKVFDIDVEHSFIMRGNEKILQAKRGKYGRIIAIVIISGFNINLWMVSEGYAEEKFY